MRLGANVISEIGPKFSSLYKGESLEDTLKMVEQYSDLIIMRHPETGSSKIAQKSTSKPFINAGDGPGEHPTQALLDLYTIFKEKKGTIDGLNIMLVGDLKYGRTIHSLLNLLKFFNVTLFLISPEQLKLPEKSYKVLHENNIPYKESEDYETFEKEADIVYVTRVQKERFSDIHEYEKFKDAYIFNSSFLLSAKKDVTIMHPLPRTNEISPDLDEYSGSAYFRQAGNGIFIRMALILLLLGKEEKV